MTSRGVLNNNPFNLDKTADEWEGEIIGDDPRFCSFSAPEYGIRAGYKVLLADENIHHLKTFNTIVPRFAPPEENNTAAYIADLVQRTGIPAYAEINLLDEVEGLQVAKAFIHHEEGYDPYPDDLVLKGIRMALAPQAEPVT